MNSGKSVYARPIPRGALRAPSVVVVERNDFSREGLACVLETAGFRVDWKAAHPDQTIPLCRQFGDAIFLLAGLPGDRHRIDVIRALHDAGVRPSIVAMVERSENVEITQLIALGVSAIVDRDDDPPKLFEAMTATHNQSEVWLSPRVAVKLIPPRHTGHDQPHLTSREREMLWRVAHGQHNEQIADEMFISLGTVRNHLSRIYSKLGVHSRAEAVAWAWRTELAQAKVGGGRQYATLGP